MRATLGRWHLWALKQGELRVLRGAPVEIRPKPAEFRTGAVEDWTLIPAMDRALRRGFPRVT